MTAGGRDVVTRPGYLICFLRRVQKLAIAWHDLKAIWHDFALVCHDLSPIWHDLSRAGTIQKRRHTHPSCAKAAKAATAAMRVTARVDTGDFLLRFAAA